MKSYPLPTYVQRFFTERLATQLHASSNTVASYRDTFRLLLKYASDRLGRQPTALQQQLLQGVGSADRPPWPERHFNRVPRRHGAARRISIVMKPAS
jgi:hypothetical protein